MSDDLDDASCLGFVRIRSKRVVTCLLARIPLTVVPKIIYIYIYNYHYNDLGENRKTQFR